MRSFCDTLYCSIIVSYDSSFPYVVELNIRIWSDEWLQNPLYGFWPLLFQQANKHFLRVLWTTLSLMFIQRGIYKTGNWKSTAFINPAISILFSQSSPSSWNRKQHTTQLKRGNLILNPYWVLFTMRRNRLHKSYHSYPLAMSLCYGAIILKNYALLLKKNRLSRTSHLRTETG